MSTGSEMFEALYADTELRGSLATAEGDTFACVLGGVGQTRDATELGLSETVDCVAHLDVATDANTALTIGKVLTLTYNGTDKRMRVLARTVKAGLLSLAMKAEHNG